MGSARGLGLLVAGGALCALVSCGGDLLGPDQPEVASATGRFQLHAPALRDVSTVLDYRWHNAGRRAVVAHSTTSDSGSARLLIIAADGRAVYDRPLAASLSERTAAGPAGDWTVRVTLARYSGTLNFRLERP